MSTLIDKDYEQIKQLIQSDATARIIVKSWSISKPTWKSLFQACEDWNTNGFNNIPTTSYKTAIDAIQTTTVQQAKMIWVIWSRWKAPQVI